MKLNKVCELEDFADPDLADAIRDVGEHKRARLPGFPKGAEHRKDWEIAMAVLALRQFGALERRSLVLGVAAGAEDTLFYLTRHVGQVFATDRYLDALEWAPEAPCHCSSSRRPWRRTTSTPPAWSSSTWTPATCCTPTTPSTASSPPVPSSTWAS